MEIQVITIKNKYMKANIIVLSLILTSCLTKGQNANMVFNINKSMVDSFDFERYEIHLNDAAEKKCQDIDFSRYNYISIEGFSEKIPIIQSTMSFRPPSIFIYVTAGKLCNKGSIKLQTYHLKNSDKHLTKIIQVFKN